MNIKEIGNSYSYIYDSSMGKLATTEYPVDGKKIFTAHDAVFMKISEKKYIRIKMHL